ncbi:hypothetical protein RUM44_002763 [Polyplax serrata]|uniref:Tudor domain-containing protein 1 n=1 Tax=Polyplax serrata TaxID=468196 RepID=A0ABR1AFN1_POLSC
MEKNITDLLTTRTLQLKGIILALQQHILRLNEYIMFINYNYRDVIQDPSKLLKIHIILQDVINFFLEQNGRFEAINIGNKNSLEKSKCNEVLMTSTPKKGFDTLMLLEKTETLIGMQQTQIQYFGESDSATKFKENETNNVMGIYLKSKPVNISNHSIKCKNNNCKKTNNFNAADILKKMIKGCEVKVEHVQSPSEFYVFFTGSNLKLFEELRQKLERIPFKKKDRHKNHILSKTGLSELLGKHVIYFSICDSRWYRAEVLDWCFEFADKFVSIFIIDTGETKCVSTDYLDVMPADLKIYPMILQRCHLGNIGPINQSSQMKKFSWMNNVTEQMRCWIEMSGTAKIQITASDCFHPQSSIPVILWLRGKDKSVNDLLVENEMAVPCNDCLDQKHNSSMQVPRNIENWNPMKEDFKANHNVYELNISNPASVIYGYIGTDHKRLCWQFINKGKCFKGKACRKDHEILNPLGCTTDKEEIFMAAFNLLPTLNVGDILDIEMTCIMNSGNFYCCMADSKVQMHDERLEALNSYINTPDNKRHMKKLLVPPCPGQVVLAKYSTDNKWYRAKILDSEPENDVFRVFFVDYGNEEYVRLSGIRAIEPMFLHLPFQAIYCQIYGLKVKGEEAAEYLYEVQHKRNLFIKIAHVFPENEIHLLVHLLDRERNNIGHELLRKGYALEKAEMNVDLSSAVLPG